MVGLRTYFETGAPPLAGGDGHGLGRRGRLPPLDLEYRDGLYAVLHSYRRARDQRAPGRRRGLRGRLAQEYLAGHGVLFEPRREVHRVAYCGVLRTPLRADVADRRHARVQADADGYLGQSVLPQLRVDDLHLPLHRDGRGDGVARVVGRGVRRAEERHQPVADVLVERAAVREDYVGHRRKVVVQKLHDALGRGVFRQAREAAYVREENRQGLVDAAELERVRVL